MSKPVQVVTWATDANLAAGTETGLSTKLEPSAGVKAQGFVPGQTAPGRWYNWLLNLVGQWTSYVDNLHGEVDFLNKNYAWTGANSHGGVETFNNDVHVTTGNDFVVDAGGTAVIHGAVYIDGSPVVVQNSEHLRLGGTTNEVLYSDNTGALVPRNRTRMVPLTSGSMVLCNYDYATGTVIAPSLAGTIDIPLEGPKGGTLTQVRFGVKNPTAGALNYSMLVARVDHSNLAAPADNTVSGLFGTYVPVAVPAGTSVRATPALAITPPSAVFDNDTSAFVCTITIDVGLQLLWVEMSYTDPGPRNY